MQMFIFQSVKDARVFGFTREREGANLPADFIPWRLTGSQDMPPAVGLAGLNTSDELLTGVDTDGFSIAGTGGVTVIHELQP
jgi:hypothetical protein